MSTEPTPTEGASATQEELPPGAAPAPTASGPAATAATAVAPGPPPGSESAQRQPGESSLPPRVDTGENIEAVLGEVGKLFGELEKGTPSLSGLADDDIESELEDLKLAGPSLAKPAGPIEPSRELKVETAADLFRSGPPDQDAPPTHSPPPVADVAAPAVTSAPGETASPAETRPIDEPAGTEDPAGSPSAEGSPEADHAASQPPPGAESPDANAGRPAVDEAVPKPDEPTAGNSAGQVAPPVQSTPPAPAPAPIPNHVAGTQIEKLRGRIAAALVPVRGLVDRLPLGALVKRLPIDQVVNRIPLRAALDRVPKERRNLALIVGALVMGWIAGVSLSALRPRSAATADPALKQALETATENSKELQEKAAALEAELHKAVEERGAAEREREEARRQIKDLETRAHKGTAAGADIQGQHAARQKADARLLAALDNVRLLQLRTYDLQLARVRDAWRKNPGLALALLEDVDRCPPALRDFTWGYFYSRVKKDRGTLVGHTGPVHAVAWSPDGKLIASCGQDGLVKFWDAGSGKEIASFAAHAGGGGGGGVTALCFSHRGDSLVTAGGDHTLKLWDVATRKIVATFFGHVGTVRAAAIASDASSLVSAGDDGTVKFWDAASQTARATRWGVPRSREPEESDDPSRLVRSVAISPDGRLIASGGYEVVSIWDASDGGEKTALTVAPGAGPVSALAFSPQGTTLAAGAGTQIYRWDLDSFVPRSNPTELNGHVNALAYSADGRMLAAATETGAVVFREPAEMSRAQRWDKGRAGAALRPIPRDRSIPGHENPLRLEGHLGAVTGIAFSADGETVVTCGVDGTLRLWNPESGAVDQGEPDIVMRGRSPATALAYAPDGKQIAVGGADVITLWNAADGIAKATLKCRSGDMTKIAFSPDGARLASAGRDWPILIWDVAAQGVKLALNGHTARVNSIAYAAEGKVLVSAGDDGTVRTWDAIGGRELSTLEGHAGPVLCVIPTPDGKLIASGGADRSVKLWDVAAKRTTATLSGHLGPVVALAISPDGRFLASAGAPVSGRAPHSNGDQRPFRLWRIPKGELSQSFGTAGSDVEDIAFSPDGKTLATSAGDGVTLWDAVTCERRETLRFPTAGRFAPLSFSPDGRTLAAGGQTAIVLWTAGPCATNESRHVDHGSKP